MFFAAKDGEALYSQRKTRLRADCGSDHELLITKFRLKLKKVGKTLDHSGITSVQFSSVTQSSLTLCDPMVAACQASLPITSSWCLLKLISIDLVMPSNHLIICHPLLLLPSIFPNMRVFSNESTFCIRWPKYWSFSFKSVLSMNTQD